MNLSTKNLELALDALEHLARHHKAEAERYGAMGLDGRWTMLESTRAQKLADTIAKHLKEEEEKRIETYERIEAQLRAEELATENN